jgi:hypothetical protein
LIIVMFTNREQEPYNSSVYAICFWPVKFSSRRLEVTFLYSNSNTTLVDKTKHVFYPLPSQPNLVQKLTNNLHTIHYSLHLLPPSYAHTAFLAPCSYTPSTYFVPSIWEVTFYTHKKQQPKLLLCIVIFVFLDSTEEGKRFQTEWY